MTTSKSEKEPFSLKERFILAYNIDPHKYEKKGLWMYLGYALLISYFTILPKCFLFVLPFLHLQIPKKLIPAFGMLIMNLIITLGYNFVMILIHKANHPFFEQFRVNKTPWMWEVDYEAWMKLLKKSILFFLINNVIVGVPLSLLDAANSKYLTSVEEAPDTITVIWQFTLFLLVEDFLFYWFHRLFHHPKLYWIHKSHHEYKNSIAFAAQTAHPLEAVTGSSLPLFLGFKILSQFTKVHVVSIWIFFLFRIIEGCDSHSGYEWGWAQAELFPFNSGSAYHNFHHSHNVGNFGSFFKFWDTLFGTNLDYIKYRLKQDQIESSTMGENEKYKKQ